MAQAAKVCDFITLVNPYLFLEGTIVNTIGDILNFLEELDENFDKEKLSPEDLKGLKEVLQNKSSNINDELTKDG